MNEGYYLVGVFLSFILLHLIALLVFHKVMIDYNEEVQLKLDTKALTPKINYVAKQLPNNVVKLTKYISKRVINNDCYYMQRHLMRIFGEDPIDNLGVDSLLIFVTVGVEPVIYHIEPKHANVMDKYLKSPHNLTFSFIERIVIGRVSNILRVVDTQPSIGFTEEINCKVLNGIFKDERGD